MRELTYNEAAIEAVAEEMRRDPKIFYMSTDALPPLLNEFGAERVRATPITEAALTGMAIGAAGCGFRPIVDWRQVTFCFVAMDQIVNQAAKNRYMFGGQGRVPLVLRMPIGFWASSAAQHSQSLETLLAHIPGLRVALPATPQDAYDLLRSAVASLDPCILFEARALYQTSGPVRTSGPIQPIGKAIVRRQGTAAAIVTWGTALGPALEAADTLKNVGVIDLRWLSPLDDESLRKVVVEAGGRVVVAHEANLTGGFGAEIVARLHEMLGDQLTLKIKRVGSPDVRMPSAPALAQRLLPNAEKIMAAVRAVTI